MVGQYFKTILVGDSGFFSLLRQFVNGVRVYGVKFGFLRSIYRVGQRKVGRLRAKVQQATREGFGTLSVHGPTLFTTFCATSVTFCQTISYGRGQGPTMGSGTHFHDVCNVYRVGHGLGQGGQQVCLVYKGTIGGVGTRVTRELGSGLQDGLV